MTAGSPEPLRDLVVGQTVRHWKFGLGRVVSTSRANGREIAGVDFGQHGECQLDVAVARLADPAAAASGHQRLPWLALVDESATLEPLGREVWAGWFGPDIEASDAELLEAWQRSVSDLRVYPVGGFGDLPAAWPEIHVLFHPSTARRESMAMGGVMVLCKGPGRDFAAAFPFYNDWSVTHRFTPRRIVAAADRVQMMVEGALHVGDGCVDLAYGAPTFVLGCAFLAADVPITLALTALAYECGPATMQEIKVRHPPEMIEALRAADFELGPDPAGDTTYRLDGMSAWLPDPRRRDLVFLRGCVAEVARIELPSPARAAWKLRVRAWQVQGVDWLVDVVFEASVWRGSDAPTVGDDVEASAWLLGECLGPARSTGLGT